jgi:hypothetical protein
MRTHARTETDGHTGSAKTPLVQFRGQWMELDRDHMQQLLEFLQRSCQVERGSAISLV